MSDTDNFLSQQEREAREEKSRFTEILWGILKRVEARYSRAVSVHIHVDDGGVTVWNLSENRMVYDADTLPEFTWRFFPEEITNDHNQKSDRGDD